MVTPRTDRDGAIRVPKAAQLVADTLRRRIVTGLLVEDEALPNETALMEQFGVSRPTLREALRILESEGLITVKRGARGGARVRLPDVRIASSYTALLLQMRGTTMEDLFHARRVIEPAAARMLAQRRSKPALKALREQHDREVAALDSPEEFAAHATQFHELLVELAGNETLSLFAKMLTDIVGRHHRATMIGAPAKRREFTEVGSEHHAHVTALIGEGRADEAEAFWRFHIDGAASRALRHLGPKTVVDLLS